MTEPTGPVTLRDLKWDDFDALVEAYFLLYDERTTNPEVGITLFATRPTIEDEVKWFADLFRRVVDGVAVCVIAEVGGRAVGSCTVRQCGGGAASEGAHLGELGLLVHRDHRGRGIGEALMRDAIRRCRGRFEAIRLAVFATNGPAKALYRKLGFETYGVEPKAVKRGKLYFDVEWMRLPL
ncbi:MAG TPA: GNAT family N-acetyltransferase [Thermoplasmata archaeon]|nr:GNAT family N-acetyltransferase [Thermoplasmata archaeon]